MDLNIYNSETCNFCIAKLHGNQRISISILALVRIMPMTCHHRIFGLKQTSLTVLQAPQQIDVSIKLRTCIMKIRSMSVLLISNSFGSSDLRLLWCGHKLRHMERCRNRSDLSGASCLGIIIHQRSKNFRFVLFLGKSKRYRKNQRIIEQTPMYLPHRITQY